MIPGNLYGANEYEKERRKDERRAAAEDWRLRELGVKSRIRLLPGIAAGLILLVILISQVM